MGAIWLIIYYFAEFRYIKSICTTRLYMSNIVNANTANGIFLFTIEYNINVEKHELYIINLNINIILYM